MKYIPNSYNKKDIDSKFGDEGSFLKWQVKYKNGLEKLFLKMIDFDYIKKIIEESRVVIPEVETLENDFYHKYSGLDNKYLCLRNNIHIERLDEEEIRYLMMNDNINDDYYFKTLEKVIYEDGDKVFLGTPRLDVMVDSKSVMFEFLYNESKCSSIEQIKMIKEVINKIGDYLEEQFREKMNLEVSLVVNKFYVNEFK